MPSPRRVKKSVRKTRKSVKKSAKTKRSYRWGGETIKISELSDANDWQKDAFDEYRNYLFHIVDEQSIYDETDPDTNYKYSKSGHVAYFTIIGNDIIYHPSKSKTDDTIDKSRTIKMWSDGDERHSKATEYWGANIKDTQPWKCVQPYNKQTAGTKDRLQSCSEIGPSIRGFAKKGGANRQECIEKCHM